MEDSELNSKKSGECSGLLEEKVVPNSGLSSIGWRFARPTENYARGLVAGPVDEARSNLHTNRTTEVNSIDRKGNTVLHSAVALACRKGDWDDSSYKRVDVLMSLQQMNLNMPNKKGYTAIGLAVYHLHRTSIERMLQHTSADRLHLDYYPGDSESTVREIIEQTYPDLQPFLPSPLMESLDSSETDKKLLAALQRGEYKMFCETVDLNNPNPWYDEPYHSYLLEIACQMKNRQEFVELLLVIGADPNIRNSVTDVPLIHATARSGNFDVLHVLLEKERTDISVEDNEERTILHWLAGVSERKPGDKEKIEYWLKLLLEPNFISKKGINSPDCSVNTALITAVERGFKGRAKLLLSNGADVLVLEHGCEVLLSASLSILEEILSDCLLSNKKSVTSKDLQLTFNEKFLMYIVPRIVESEHLTVLLRHPVISSFLSLKWQKIRLFFYFDIAVYVIFLCILTVYILFHESHNILNASNFANNTTGHFGFNDSYVTSGMNDNKVISQWNNFMDILWYPLSVLLVILSGREIIQLFMFRKAYVLSLENWLEISLIVASFMSYSGVLDGSELKLHFTAIALLLGWLELLLMSGRIPLVSLQFEMLRTVSWTFLTYMARYAILLIAFILSFHILFRGSSVMFSNPLLSLLKTVVMLTGEFEASNLSFETAPYTSHVIFLLFVFLVTIILLNLLNGLAVSDTDAIRKNAETLSLSARVRLISKIEAWTKTSLRSVIPSTLLTKEQCIFYPNRPNSIGSTLLRNLLSIVSMKGKANKKWHSPVGKYKWRMVTEKFSSLELGQKKLEKKIEETQQILRQLLKEKCFRRNLGRKAQTNLR